MPLILAVALFVCLLPANASGAALVEVLVPGFRVDEIPVRLSNINNLRFSPEGKLTALGYDGRIHLLHDTDGDGLEDKAEPFWEERTLLVPVGMHWTSKGLYVSSNRKISLFPDENGDGRADREEIVATNWPAIGVHSGNVDATAVTVDGEGNVYFGILTENYANPYLLKDGVAHYNLQSRRGTIQKLSAETGELEMIATGVRVPYTLAFNRHGDLFLTDQEGETWCPGGNPLDELNHIVPGKNYGFPPRHPEYLPGLISEPPVVSFGPQHQSTCGLVFNEGRPGRGLFGPTSWQDDAFVTGQSRGKIWRVPLLKTPHGYLGKEILFARLQMLTTDVAISPRGDLYVSCHSGKPDWGTGPKGEGKLFRIKYADSSAPQPAAVWPAGPMELWVAFDRALHEEITSAPKEIEIEFGLTVRPADRLETLKPPYKVVQEQEQIPRGKLQVVGAELTEDRRTLILTTDPHPQSVNYSISIPRVRSADSVGQGTRVDLGYDLAGVAARWMPEGGSKAEWKGSLPHLDSKLNRALTTGSAPHQRLQALVSRRGVLELSARLIPPSRAQYLRLERKEPFSADWEGKRHDSREGEGVNWIEIETGGDGGLLEVRIPTGVAPSLQFHAAYSSEEDREWRPWPVGSVLLPWAPMPPGQPELKATPTELAGGDFERGRRLFFSEQLKCATCHRIRGEGSELGPDLSNLIHRDAGSVLRDIVEPNALINPDHVSYHIELENGSAFTGLVRAQDRDAVRLVDAAAEQKVIPREEIASMEVSAVSLMPSGLLEGRRDSEVRDLLTFLLHAPPERTREETARLVAASGTPAEPGKRLKIVLVANKQDHGPGQHDYPHWQTNFSRFLSDAAGVEVENAWEWPSAEQFAEADVIAFYYWNRSWTPEKFARMDAFFERGGGMLIFHSATISDNFSEELAKRIGLAATPRIKYLHAPMNVKFTATTNHPIAAGFSRLYLLDEPYWPMIGDTNRIKVLATAEQEGKEWPMIWTYEPGKGRVFASIPGHYTWTHEDPLFRVLVLRALAWTAREHPGRFLPLLEQTREGTGTD